RCRPGGAQLGAVAAVDDRASWIVTTTTRSSASRWDVHEERSAPGAEDIAHAAPSAAERGAEERELLQRAQTARHASDGVRRQGVRFHERGEVVERGRAQARRAPRLQVVERGRLAAVGLLEPELRALVGAVDA